MKYKKGTIIKAHGESLTYIDEFQESDGSLTLVCGSGGEFVYVSENDAISDPSTFEEKMLHILADMSATMIRLNQNIEQMQGALFNSDTCDCDGCNDAGPEDLDLN